MVKIILIIDNMVRISQGMSNLLCSDYDISQPERDRASMLVYCWATVCDAGPTLNQHWGYLSCWLDIVL